MDQLTSRWTRLKAHPIQRSYWESPHRFNIVSAGRRSGKTELVKRKIVKCAMRGTKFDRPRFFAAAPIREQAKRIYWADLKSLVPTWIMDGKPSETELVIRLKNASEIHVFGMDAPERIEGSPWDGGSLDEYANMKEGAWGENVRPALADRRGWCDLIGVPEGRNHYYEMNQRAIAEMALRGDKAEFGSFTWKSADILSTEEIEAAKRDLPPLVFAQEYEGSFVNWSGVEFFSIEKWLENGLPVAFPTRCQSIFATIDTAVKDGKQHDGTAVLYCATNDITGPPLILLDYDIIQIEGSLLEGWLPNVFIRLEELAAQCGARQGSVGALIEDKATGSTLLQTAARRGWPAIPVDSAFTSIGKDERAISISGYHYQEKIKISQHCYDKLVMFKDRQKNHLIDQVMNFRIGDKEGYKRADDLADCYFSAVSSVFGNSDGY